MIKQPFSLSNKRKHSVHRIDSDDDKRAIALIISSLWAAILAIITAISITDLINEANGDSDHNERKPGPWDDGRPLPPSRPRHHHHWHHPGNDSSIDPCKNHHCHHYDYKRDHDYNHVFEHPARRGEQTGLVFPIDGVIDPKTIIGRLRQRHGHHPASEDAMGEIAYWNALHDDARNKILLAYHPALDTLGRRLVEDYNANVVDSTYCLALTEDQWIEYHEHDLTTWLNKHAIPGDRHYDPEEKTVTITTITPDAGK